MILSAVKCHCWKLTYFAHCFFKLDTDLLHSLLTYWFNNVGSTANVTPILVGKRFGITRLDFGLKGGRSIIETDLPHIGANLALNIAVYVI